MAAAALSAAGCQANAAHRDATPPYDAADTITWRQTREADLQKPEGWLAVAGLHFLEPGENTIGTGSDNAIVLPPGSGPARAGRVRLADRRVSVTLDPGVDAQLNGQPAAGEIELRGPSEAEKRREDRLTIGRAIVHLHHSGERLALRVRDPESALRKHFVGLRWYDVDAAWRIEGRFLPFAETKKLQVQNVLGDLEDAETPGEVEVTIGGQTVRLLPMQAARGRLWFVFTDATAAAGETYKIRFLYADAPKNGRVVLDFNRAYNPPCAYNPHTTCPLPPSQNKLTVPVPAGERAYPGPHETSTSSRLDLPQARIVRDQA